MTRRLSHVVRFRSVPRCFFRRPDDGHEQRPAGTNGSRKRPGRPLASLGVLACSLAAWLIPNAAEAQQAWSGGARWSYRRTVVCKPAPAFDGQVAVVAFWAHGAVTDETPDFLVLATAGQRGEVPYRVLQRGPGDFVRLAIQTVGKTAGYQVYYGGKRDDPPPAWTTKWGLLFEVHRFRNCNFSQLDSVRSAFEQSEPLGAAYVGTCYLSNPLFCWNESRLICRFSGWLHVRQPGKYRFAVSSRDGCWLLIDDKLVAAWPGRHRPARRAFHYGEVELTRGAHAFQFWNISGGGAFTAVAVWQPPGETRYSVIPPEAFGPAVDAQTTRLEARSGGVLPDVRALNYAEAPLGEGRPPLVRVKFRTQFNSGTLYWDFGDGQTSNRVYPEHVYLKPGLYTVRCSRVRGHGGVENRIQVEPPWPRLGAEDATGDIAQWVNELRSYDPSTLPADDLRQLMAVYQELEMDATAAEVGETGLIRRKPTAPPLDPDQAARAFEDLVTLLDERLNRQTDAIRLCDEGLKLSLSPQAKARLWLLSARLELLLDRPEECLRRLKEAEALVQADRPSELVRLLYEVRGAFAKRMGKKDAAEQAYQWLEKQAPSRRWDIRRRTAMTGAYSRAVEDALRSGRLDEACQSLKKWATDMPSCRLDGYYCLLKARFELARGRPRVAILEAEDLLRLQPDSPYADRLLLTEAEAYVRLGESAQWQQTLERLLKQYPGSPFVPDVKQALAAGFDAARKQWEQQKAEAEKAEAEKEQAAAAEASRRQAAAGKPSAQKTQKAARPPRKPAAGPVPSRPARPAVRRPGRPPRLPPRRPLPRRRPR